MRRRPEVERTFENQRKHLFLPGRHSQGTVSQNGEVALPSRDRIDGHDFSVSSSLRFRHKTTISLALRITLW